MDLVDAEKVGLSADRLDRIGSFFRTEYVDTGRLASVLTLVARRGQVAHLSVAGDAAVDSVWRLYSMTKPVTSVALMQLYEEGRFLLDDPVGAYLPELADLRVYVDGATSLPAGPVTVQHLLTHTAGFTYGFLMETPVDRMYRQRGVGTLEHRGDLAGMVTAVGSLPLLFQPGTAWNYSVATDVCGRLVEVLSGRSFDEYLADRVFGPLGMNETGFSVRPEQAGRFLPCYAPGPDGAVMIDDPAGSPYLRPPTFLSGGGGLVGTAEDYLRFCSMLLNGGALDGARVLGRKTVEFMTANHLPGGRDLAGMGRPRFNGQSFEGIGFGLGFAVLLDPAASHTVGTPGQYFWGGAASTMFFVDPAEELIAILLTQLMPSSTYPLRRQMRALTYQALID